MAAVASVVMCGMLIVLARRRERAVVRRLARLLAAERPARRRRCLHQVLGWGKDWIPVAVAGLTCWVMIGGLAGCVVGLAAAIGVRKWLRRRHQADGTETGTAGDSDLPLAADLLAACIAAGAAPDEAAAAVGESLVGPIGERLARIAAELRLGAEPAAAWGQLAEIPGGREPARCLARSGVSGAPAAESVTRLAVGLRAEQARTATARARTAAVLITAPVGLCFLPAFLALGVAPVVAGLADVLLGG
jgi:Flp pilus assembly protein TadB